MQEVPFASFFEEDDLFEQNMTEDFFQGKSNNSFYLSKKRYTVSIVKLST
jgi:hypothetical protein